MLLHPTYAEYILYNYLNKIKIDFIPQCICIAEHWYIMDCYLPKYHINIEIDGGIILLKNKTKRIEAELKKYTKHTKLKRIVLQINK